MFFTDVMYTRLKREANMNPKVYYDFGGEDMANIGFFKKGWIRRWLN